MSGAPDPKSRSLARGEHRRFRHKATKAEWRRIVKAKLGPCRVCVTPTTNGGYKVAPTHIELHHLVPRAQGGDDVEENVVPLCARHHAKVTRRAGPVLRMLAASLTDSEYAYVVSKLGESGPARLFGVGRG